MQIILVDLNNKNTLDLNNSIQVQQGDSALPIVLVFKYGTDTVDMSDGKVGFISGVTANGNNVEFENLGNSSGQCVITLNSYAFQAAGNYQWLYVGVKDANGNVLTSVPASLSVLPNKLNTNLDTGDYRDDWQIFKNGLTSEVDNLNSDVNSVASQASAVNNSLATMTSNANSEIDNAVFKAQSAVTNANSEVNSAVSYATSTANSAAEYATSATDKAVSQAKSETSQAISACNNAAADAAQTTVNINGNIQTQISNSFPYYTSNSLLNGSTGTIKLQKLNNVVIVNIIQSGATSGNVIAQVPSGFIPTTTQQAACVEANSNGSYLNFFGIDTSGNICIYQRVAGSDLCENIDCNATFSYFIN